MSTIQCDFQHPASAHLVACSCQDTAILEGPVAALLVVMASELLGHAIGLGCFRPANDVQISPGVDTLLPSFGSTGVSPAGEAAAIARMLTQEHRLAKLAMQNAGPRSRTSR